VTVPADISGLSNAELLELVLEQRRLIGELREEIARLKGLKGRPDIKPQSGMEKGPTQGGGGAHGGRRGRGKSR